MFVLFFFLPSLMVSAQRVEYLKEDSVRIERLLKQAVERRGSEERMLYFGRQFLNVPYVAHTLELGTEEHLIVNTRALDCTTFVETCAALSICDAQQQCSFRDFCNNLQRLRYRGGHITDYTSRLHYFTQWGEDNSNMQLVESVLEKTHFSGFATQKVDIHYMSKHPNSYKQLRLHPSLVSVISRQERELKGRTYPYLPKSKLNLPSAQIGFIHTGDIVAIITSKDGLDTSHIGVAVWQDGRLHLMHASNLYKKVVLDKKTFYDYSQGQPSQLGIRVFRLR